MATTVFQISHARRALDGIAKAVCAAESAGFSPQVLRDLDAVEVKMRQEMRAEAARRDALYEGPNGQDIPA